MNVVLFESSERDSDGIVTVDGRRAEHVRNVLSKGPGETIVVGEIDGKIAEGTIVAADAETLRFTVAGQREPVGKSRIHLVLALPRPPVLRRVLAHATAMGVEKITLLHTKRVQKSYWQSPALEPANIRAQLLLGLEQSVDTRLPEVDLARRFLPFVEDVLPQLPPAAQLILADPSGPTRCRCDVLEPIVLCVGPEGGFIDHERERFTAAGAVTVSLGPRILRVETATMALLGRLGGI